MGSRRGKGGIFSRAEYIRALRLTSKLVDLQAGYTNSHSALCAEVSSRQHHSDKKKKRTDNRKGYLFFSLVEVAGLELAASSTRNWRATNCATPRFCWILTFAGETDLCVGSARTFVLNAPSHSRPLSLGTLASRTSCFGLIAS